MFMKVKTFLKHTTLFDFIYKKRPFHIISKRNKEQNVKMLVLKIDLLANILNLPTNIIIMVFNVRF